MTDPYECWLHAETVPGFLAGYADVLGVPLDVDDVLDRLLDTDTGRGRWLVLPVSGPLHVELAGEPGTGAVEVRARPTGPGADDLLAALPGLGAVYGR
ncbi:MAG: hypothetical protein JWO60_958 [Frankiales bacterium]|nr:hypothetical protein [Frankiales bacterium]